MVERLKEEEELAMVGKKQQKGSGNHGRSVRGRVKGSVRRAEGVNTRNIAEMSKEGEN